jgi:uncharacterized protein (DUF4415 family)
MKRTSGKPLNPDQLDELAALARLPDADIDTSEVPEVRNWSGAERGLFYRPVKQQLTLRLDSDIVAWFRGHATSRAGYQTRMNQALREYAQRHGGSPTSYKLTDAPQKEFADDSSEGAFGKWLAAFQPIVQDLQTYRWEGDDIEQFWHFLRRAVIIRQFEGLEAIRALIAAKQGNLGAIFLRTAFEELVWVEYLKKHADLANVLLMRITHHEVASSLIAQLKYIGAKEMAEGGFTPQLIARWLLYDIEARDEIREIGKQLGWRMGRASTLPSIFYLSKEVGREEDYKFLYHGTSRYVHFSTQEILRRVWGKKGEVTISSRAFQRYWIDFAISWGSRLFLDLLTVCVDDLAGLNEDRMFEITEAQKLLPRFALKVPIITANELKSWAST